MTNFWIDLLRREEELKNEIMSEIDDKVKTKLHLNAKAIETMCLGIAEEVSNRMGYGSYDLDIQFDIESFTRKYRHYFTPEKHSVWTCKIKHLYLHQ
jgi:hypothetical protein